MSKVGVLIVEDSLLMQKAISEMISSDPDIEVIGKAGSGKEALEKADQLNPDVITLLVRRLKQQLLQPYQSP